MAYSVTAAENKLKPCARALLTCHDPLGFVGLHVASTLALSCFALEVVLGIKGIGVVISYGHLQGGRECEAIFGFVSPLCTARQTLLWPTETAPGLARRGRGAGNMSPPWGN